MFINFMKELAAVLTARSIREAFADAFDIIDRSRGKGRGNSVSTVLALHRQIQAAGRPTDARRWHKPDDPHQQHRIEAAKAKRERRAAVLHKNTCRSYAENRAHREPNWQPVGRTTLCGVQGSVMVAPLSWQASSLNPFAVNRSGAV